MSTNKNALTRYKMLDKCFRNPGRNYTLDVLLDECNKAIWELNPDSDGIKRRQLQYDISDMESIFDIELAEGLKTGKKKVFRYLDPHFSIFNQKLNETDANQLNAAILALSRLQYDWADELAVRLREEFDIADEPRKIIEFEENEFLEGKEYVNELYNAILYKKVLRVTYQKFDAAESHEFVIHPYYLKQYNSRWFLFGSAGFSSLTNLPLDRIQKIENLDHDYLEADIDFKEYLEDVVGVTVKEAPCEKIVLRTTAKVFHYIDTKPIHGSQKILEFDKNQALIELDLISNYEFESKILAFGEGVEVLEPIHLRDRMRERIELMQQKYV